MSDTHHVFELSDVQKVRGDLESGDDDLQRYDAIKTANPSDPSSDGEPSNQIHDQNNGSHEELIVNDDNHLENDEVQLSSSADNNVEAINSTAQLKKGSMNNEELMQFQKTYLKEFYNLSEELSDELWLSRLSYQNSKVFNYQTKRMNSA